MCGNGAVIGMTLIIIVILPMMTLQVLLRAIAVCFVVAAGVAQRRIVAVLIAAEAYHPTRTSTSGSVSPYRMVDSYIIPIKKI